jgi:ribonucleotide monophosphatase NagD (HAD superfamily)
MVTKPEVRFKARHVTLPFPGAIAQMLETATNKKAVVMGKPSEFLATVLFERERDTPRNRFLMVGDTIDTDVIFGNKNGMQTLLVGTGTSSLGDVEKIVESGGDVELIPQFFIPRLIDLLTDGRFC